MENDERIITKKQSSDVSIKDWMMTYLITCIPFVGIVMMFIWAFGSSDIPESKKNWAKVAIIWAVISFIIGIFLFSTVFAGLLATSLTLM